MSLGEQTIIIKKVKKVQGGGHHGGAWKVAYADFVTAMMAFFLLMWLINTTSPEQKKGIADYFAPASVSPSTSGSGGILGGTALGDDGVKSDGSVSVMEQMAPDAPETTRRGDSADVSGDTDGMQTGVTDDAMAEARKRQEEAAFASAAASLKQAMQDLPELAELSKHLLVDVTPEGLRIQLVDQEGRSMYAQGSAKPNERARLLLRAVARVVNQLPNRVTISGHTSASTGRSEGDWGLSAARADSARLILQGAGVDPDRFFQVAGRAASEPLFPDDPTLAGNRRIALVQLREAPVLPPDHGL
ncbi:MAG TPA: flagellar motor protein MotB [Caulobacteraceae bacterium]